MCGRKTHITLGIDLHLGGGVVVLHIALADLAAVLDGFDARAEVVGGDAAGAEGGGGDECYARGGDEGLSVVLCCVNLVGVGGVGLGRGLRIGGGIKGGKGEEAVEVEVAYREHWAHVDWLHGGDRGVWVALENLVGQRKKKLPCSCRPCRDDSEVLTICA